MVNTTSPREALTPRGAPEVNEGLVSSDKLRAEPSTSQNTPYRTPISRYMWVSRDNVSSHLICDELAVVE